MTPPTPPPSAPSAPSAPSRATPPRAARLWPIGVGAVLALTMGVNFWIMRIAGSDPSVVVEADYYQKAVDYDAELAQARRNLALGWRLEPTLAPVGPDHRAAVRVALRDSAGAPLTGASVRVQGFSIARSATVVAATLRPDADGYAGELPVAHLGRWELRVTATRGGERFTAVERLDAVPAPAQHASRTGR